MKAFELGAADSALRQSFESGSLPPAEFSHEKHVRLAYAYLVDSSVDEALMGIRTGLRNYLRVNGIDPAKYHETLTQAWILAVRHFMRRCGSASSADDFLARNPELLDSRIMLTHYSKEQLFSSDARQTFVEPDLDPIPR